MRKNRWRKIPIMLLLTATLVAMLTGCMRVGIDITLKSNGKADISMLYAFQDSLASMMDDGEDVGLNSEEIESFREQGAEVAEYAEDGYTGYLITMKDTDLNASELTEGSSGALRKENGLYILDLNLLSDEEAGELDASAASMVKSAGGYFTVTVTQPVEPENHNATKVSEDGKTLEWDMLTMDRSEPIHVEYKAENNMPVVAAVIGLVVILAVVCVAVLLTKKRKAPAEAEHETREWQSPEQEAESAQDSDLQEP